MTANLGHAIYVLITLNACHFAASVKRETMGNSPMRTVARFPCGTVSYDVFYLAPRTLFVHVYDSYEACSSIVS